MPVLAEHGRMGRSECQWQLLVRSNNSAIIDPLDARHNHRRSPAAPDGVINVPCSQQQNAYDCGIFVLGEWSFAIQVHLTILRLAPFSPPAIDTLCLQAVAQS